MSGWFPWWDASSKPDLSKAKQGSQDWQIGTPGSLGENPSLREPLEDIPEASSEAESTTTSYAMEKEKSRRIREIRAYMAEQDDDKRRTIEDIREYVTENRQDSLLSMTSETFTRREAYKVARENLSSSEDTGDYTYNTETVNDSVVSEEVARENLSASEDTGDYTYNTETVNDSVVSEEIDYEAVEQYDHAFNEFIAANPEFVMFSPDLVHSLRVCKLQKLLERGCTLEAELSDKYEKIQGHKVTMENHYQKELKDASRRKAARSISLASKLTATKKATDEMEAKLLWRIFSTYEFNAKKQHRLREQLKKTTVGQDRWNLMAVLPRSKECQSIRDAMLAPASFRKEPLSKEQENDLMQFQIDNAILHSEIAVLQKKLAHVKATTKNDAWVESMLVRMDPKVRRKLKTKYENAKKVSL